MRDTALHAETCPHPDCGAPLSGLGRYCHRCSRYTDEDQPPGKANLTADPIPDDRLEKEIETGIVQTLQTLQWAVYRTSQPRASMVTAGLPDLWVAGHGTHGWLEVKRPKRGRMSDAQSLFQQVVTENGGRYAVVRSEEEAVEVTEAWREDAKREVA